MREALIVLSVLFVSLGVLMCFAAYEFPTSRMEVLPWVFLSFLWGSMTVLVYGLWVTRPKPKPRRPLDEFAGQVMEVEMPTEYTTRH